MTPTQQADDAAFGAVDLQLLAAIRRHDLGLRSVLCTLARHGVVLRQAQPTRAQAWLDELAVHPLYKGGQFLFDLLEWEDFMLDGEAPPALDGPALQHALARLTDSLHAISAGLGGPVPSAVPTTVDPGFGSTGGELPALRSSFYLYQDVVLGAVRLLTQRAAV
jgi:hypothetical protein